MEVGRKERMSRLCGVKGLDFAARGYYNCSVLCRFSEVQEALSSRFISLKKISLLYLSVCFM